MPDKPSPRRRFQFHLRTLLMIVTLVCITASWIGWRRYIDRLDDEARTPNGNWPPHRDLLRPKESTADAERQDRLLKTSLRQNGIRGGEQPATQP